MPINRVEKWKPVFGYEGLYEVSDRGRVKSLRTNRLMKPVLATSSTRRLKVVLTPKSGKPKNMYIHTLMLEAFVSPRPEGMMSRHLNDDGEDNRLANLVWGTSSENALDRVCNGIHNHARKTHCKRGHEFTPENTYVPPSGVTKRVCRLCAQARQRGEFIALPNQ